MADFYDPENDDGRGYEETSKKSNKGWWWRDHDYDYRDYSYSKGSGSRSWMSKIGGGYSDDYWKPKKDTTEVYQDLLNQLQVLLGGRTAEEIAIGEISTGAQNDLQRATDIARSMVTEWGMSDVLGQYARDYPKGPHDQPQSMCPAFGSLRVGLRMRRTAMVLSGSACCVYGLTFTSHFYGARRSVGYVPFNSETLVTGKLFEDIRDAVIAQANPEHVDAVVVINKGTRDGLENGHVLALYRAGAKVVDPSSTLSRDTAPTFQLPDERYGLVLVFRTFSSVSYALIMESSRPVAPGDVLRTP